MNTQHLDLAAPASIEPRLLRRSAWAAVAAALFSLPAVPVSAATITVTTTAEVAPNTTHCTLKDAVRAANAGAAFGGCAKGDPGLDTIELPANAVFSHASSFSSWLKDSLLRVNSEVVINGNGSTLRLSPRTRAELRLIYVAPDSQLTINDLTLSGGREDGAGIYADDDSVVVLNRSQVIDSVAGRASEFSQRAGGGIYTKGTLTLNHSRVAGNTAYGFGGGIYAWVDAEEGSEVRVTLNHSEVSDNRIYAVAGEGGVSGGGISLAKGRLTLNHSSVSGNGAYPAAGSTGGGEQGSGGGIRISLGTLEINQSLVSENYASNTGGGISAGASTLTLRHSTLSANAAQGSGAIDLFGGELTMEHSTITGNTTEDSPAGAIALHKTRAVLQRNLVAGNVASSDLQDKVSEISVDAGSSLVLGHNVLGHADVSDAQAFAGFTPGATDLTATFDGTQPTALGELLDVELADNGGPTRTHALPAKSPAVDFAPTAKCADVVDQRGVNRPRDGDALSSEIECDAGAYERGVNRINLELGKTASALAMRQGEQVEFQLQVRNHGPESASAVRLLDLLPPILALMPESLRTSQGRCEESSIGSLSCVLGGLAVGESLHLSYTARALAEGFASTSASVSGAANESDVLPQDNDVMLGLSVAGRVRR